MPLDSALRRPLEQPLRGQKRTAWHQVLVAVLVTVTAYSEVLRQGTVVALVVAEALRKAASAVPHHREALLAVVEVALTVCPLRKARAAAYSQPHQVQALVVLQVVALAGLASDPARRWAACRETHQVQALVVLQVVAPAGLASDSAKRWAACSEAHQVQALVVLEVVAPAELVSDSARR